MKDIIIHEDFLRQFLRVSHMDIFMYILVHADENGIYHGSIEDIANFVGQSEEEVSFIITNNIDVERVENGIYICDHEQFLPMTGNLTRVEADEEDDEEELVLAPEKPRTKHARKNRESLPAVEQKFQESMSIFYPNLSKLKTPLTLKEYNVLCKYVMSATGLSVASTNELIIDILQCVDESPTLRRKRDAYRTVRNWINLRISQRNFNVEFYRNLNIQARKDEREAIKRSRIANRLEPVGSKRPKSV